MPTPIQAAVIPVASSHRDVIGVAQTVCYHLNINPYPPHFFPLTPPPGFRKNIGVRSAILHHLLSQPRPHPNKRRPVRALILAPTRELAIQVSSHLNECLNPVDQASVDTNEGEKRGKSPKTKGKGKEREESTPNPSSKRPPPHVSVAAIVGGMSSQKQHRILSRGVDVLVATPGRLWDILENVRVRCSKHHCPTDPTFRMTIWLKN